MKRILPLFLLGIFLFNYMGYYFVFEVQQEEIKSTVAIEIAEGRTFSDLSTFTFSARQKNDYELMDGGKEIRINGHYYDIIQTTKTGETITFHCYNDEDETLLFAGLSHQVENFVGYDKKQGDTSSKKISNTVVKLYCEDKDAVAFFSDNRSQAVNTFIPLNITSASIPASIPPPELA